MSKTKSRPGRSRNPPAGARTGGYSSTVFRDFTGVPELVRHGSDMVGFVWNNAYRSVSGGAGYLVSRRLVENFATVLPRRGPFEDVEFSRAARRLGFEITHDPRLQVGRGQPPAPENGRITSHWCSPGVLHEIDAGWNGAA